ncbi:MAG: hypothetical protein AAF617_01310 [Bacteroidota bacterium]
MKKKNLNKKLLLGKKQISKLGHIRGGDFNGTVPITTEQTKNALQCGTNPITTTNTTTATTIQMVCDSQLQTACQCEPSWYTNCPSINFPCPTETFTC